MANVDQHLLPKLDLNADEVRQGVSGMGLRHVLWVSTLGATICLATVALLTSL
jgi:hypothetical protein